MTDDKKLSPFWAKIEADRKKRIDEEIARGLDNPDTREAKLTEAQQRAEAEKKLRRRAPTPRPRKSRALAPGLGRGKGRAPQFDREQMARLHAEGLTDTDIAHRVGCTVSTVGYWRRGAGLTANRVDGTYLKPNKRSHTCPRGHDLSIHGTQRWIENARGEKIRNGWSCAACPSL